MFQKLLDLGPEAEDLISASLSLVRTAGSSTAHLANFHEKQVK